MDLPLHSYQLERTASGARLVNAYAEQAPPQNGKGPVVVRRSPGIAVRSQVGNGPGRGLHVMGGNLYAASGNALYRVKANGDANTLGTISGTGRVWMADNGAQMAVSAGGVGYVFASGAVSAISDVDFTARAAGPVAFLDNYALWIDRDSGQFFSSSLADFTAYDGLDFATAEGAPDNLVTLAVDHRQAVLIGEKSTELWYNAGGSGFPFDRAPGGFMEIGGAAEFGVTKVDNSVVWLANDLTVRRINGATPQRVSQHGVERAIQSYTRVDNCRAFSYTLDGHICAAFVFDEGAWIYDATTGEWHERQTYGSPTWDVSGIAEAYGRVYVQRASTGEIGVMSRETFTEWDGVLRSEWTYQNVYSRAQRIFHGSIELGVETGVGLVSGQGSDPRIMLEVSDDGGRTWLSLPARSLGARGDYRQRVRWHRLGSSFDRVYRFAISDPVPLTVWATELEVTA